MGRKMTPQAKKRRTVEKRKMTMQSRQRGHARNIAAAGDDLLNGNPQPLIALMEESPPKGSMGAEKQALKELTAAILASGAIRGQHMVKADSEPIPGGEETIDALQKLRQRCEERKSPKRAVTEPLRSLVGAQAYIHLYKEGIDELKKNADDIGPLPQTCRAESGWSNHLLGADGRTVCGETVNDKEEKDSILTCRSLYCRDCHEKRDEGVAVAEVSPEDWVKEIEEKDAAMLRYPYMWREPSLEPSGKELLEDGRKRLLANLADVLQEYNIKTPKSWS